MKPGYRKWTKDQILEKARLFKTRSDWLKGHPPSYQASRKYGYHEEATKGMLKKGRLNQHAAKWTKESAHKEALKYKSKKEWTKHSAGSRMYAIRNGWYDEFSKHMSPLGNLHRRCLYTIEIKGENKIYVGLTNNFNLRMQRHYSSKRFKNYKKDQLIVKQITQYIDRIRAAEIETKLIVKKKQAGYEVLNVRSGGEFGGGKLIWTKAMLFESARKYKNRTEWSEKDPKAYGVATKKSYYNELTSHMELLNEKYKWANKDAVLTEAKKFKHKIDWYEKSPGSYAAAKKLGWFDEALTHMTIRKHRVVKWTKEAIIKDAKRFKYKSDWKKYSISAFMTAEKNGWYKDAVAHMPAVKEKKSWKWSKEAVLNEAKKHLTKNDWRLASAASYTAAHRNGWFEEAIKHMQVNK